MSPIIFFDYFAEAMSPMYSLIILGNPSPKPTSSLLLFLYFQPDAFIQTLGI